MKNFLRVFLIAIAISSPNISGDTFISKFSDIKECQFLLDNIKYKFVPEYIEKNLLKENIIRLDDVKDFPELAFKKIKPENSDNIIESYTYCLRDIFVYKFNTKYYLVFISGSRVVTWEDILLLFEEKNNKITFQSRFDLHSQYSTPIISIKDHNSDGIDDILVNTDGGGTGLYINVQHVLTIKNNNLVQINQKTIEEYDVNKF